MLKIVTPNQDDYSLVSHARSILKRVALKTYHGWNDVFDLSFDRRSKWIISVDDSGKIYGFCRIVLANKDQRLPVEYNEELISINKTDVQCAEVTSYVFRDREQALIIARAALLEIERLGCERCFSSVDTINTNALTLITKTYGFRPFCANPITFAGMHYTKRKGTPNWVLLFQNRTTRMGVIANLTISI